MADAETKATSTEEREDGRLSTHDPVETFELAGPRPDGWKYRERRIGKLVIPWYASPRAQLLLVSFVCFLCPGMFNALGGLGGGGKQDPTLADNMLIALYSTFAVVGFFAGSFVNKLGVKLTLAFGGLGYCIYSISLLASVHANVGGFNIFAGALLGVCAGLLWTAQGTIMLSYPKESEKGRSFAIFWMIFNLGGVIGSLVISQLTAYVFQIPLGENIHVKGNVTVTDGTYIAFIVLMFVGAVVGMFLCNATDIIRDDGSKVVLKKNPSWQSEFIGLYETIRSDPHILLLFPMFWSSNWFTTYQQNSVNGAHFSTRTKALNGLLFWLAQLVGALILGYALDLERFSRPTRAKASLAVLLILGVAIEAAVTRTRKTTRARPMFLYFFYGFYDAA
ncbi:hypothetical protein VE04_06516, partial [Pseudogymnoascus sp. 24MN13]